MKQLALFKSIYVITFLFICSSTQAAILYADDDASGSNNGSSWANAYTDLQDALTSAISGDEIWVATGTYLPGTLRSSEFTLKSDVALYGGFDGSGTTLDQRGKYFDNPSILDGNIGDSSLDTDNCYHTVMIANASGSFFWMVLLYQVATQTQVHLTLKAAA